MPDQGAIKDDLAEPVLAEAVSGGWCIHRYSAIARGLLTHVWGMNWEHETWQVAWEVMESDPRGMRDDMGGAMRDDMGEWDATWTAWKRPSRPS